MINSMHHGDNRILDLLETIENDKGRDKFTCEKEIRSISESEPQQLYPYFDRIEALMDSTNNFIKWGAVITISNLVAVDIDRKFPPIYEKYFDLIKSDSMITAANAAGNAWKIVGKYPEYESDITNRLLEVADRVYINKGEVSPECQRILCGHVLDCFDKYFERSSVQDKMIGFAQGLTDCCRNTVADKAQRFLKKHPAT